MCCYSSNLRLRVRVFVLFCPGGCINERGNFLCVGYACTWDYASNLILRIAVFRVLNGGILIIERGSLLCRWLHVYAWLRFKIKGNFTAVRSWSPDQSTRQFLLAISFIVK